MLAVVFANGVFNDSRHTRSVIESADILIAADGGSRHCFTLGLVPDVVIGDFDSLEPGELDRMAAAGSQIIQHPARKDYTDLELALQHAASIGADEIVVLAALGARWDQTLANLLLPASNAFTSYTIRLLDGQQEVYLLRGGNTLELHGLPGDTVSLVPLCGDATGITTQGLEYPLQDGTLLFGSTRGISNVLTRTAASVSLTQGLLVGVVIHAREED